MLKIFEDSDKNAVKVELMQENLQAIRQLAGWTTAELASRIGVTKQTISNIERGRTKLSLTQYFAVRAVLDYETSKRPKDDILQKALALLIDKADKFSDEKYIKIKNAINTIAAASYSKTEPIEKGVLLNLFEHLVSPVISDIDIDFANLKAAAVNPWLADLFEN